MAADHMPIQTLEECRKETSQLGVMSSIIERLSICSDKINDTDDIRYCQEKLFI